MNTLTRFFLVAALAVFSSLSFAQPCPGLQPGNPANHLQEVKFYDANGNLLTSCNCQLTGNGFKCGSCAPSNYAIYQYIYSGVVVNCINGMVLPVELSTFEAIVSNGQLFLHWTTQSERDNEKFILERSADGETFEVMAEVEGALNSTTELHYNLTDVLPLEGTSYYRLKQVDLNGSTTVSGMVSVEIRPETDKLMLIPNPAAGSTTVQLPIHAPGEIVDLQITDQSGKLMLKTVITEDTKVELPAGFYVVTGTSGNRSWSSRLIIL